MITGNMNGSMEGPTLGGGVAKQRLENAFNLEMGLYGNRVGFKFQDFGVNPTPGFYSFPLEEAIKVRDGLNKAIAQLQTFTQVVVK